MPGIGEGRGEEGRKKERMEGRGEKKSKNTPSVNSCLRPCGSATIFIRNGEIYYIYFIDIYCFYSESIFIIG